MKIAVNVDTYNVDLGDIKPGWYMKITAKGHIQGIGKNDSSTWSGRSFIENNPIFPKLEELATKAAAELAARLETAGFTHNVIAKED